ncbi:doublecortin domain-containing protein 2C isoform X2 [Trachypithecus francoisi]|uniref:doublecortin domain-containing protein 2C isoform X2 n=1 Tax=Trachypithecus francoisi TaxID=54180 RepID=UPI00141BC7ED|nr:doublecortin domain-containing protein 2C isoform X2 [Trachypithecus francoisi]
MGTRGPSALVDTTPAKTIVVYRNGDPFYVGKKFVLSRRCAATFEALLEQLTEQVDVPFGVRGLFTPTRGHQVLGLDALQAGGKYVAAGRERFKELDYIHIVPRKPAKIRKLKEIKPVVHCDINVPSKWQTYHRISRHINVFTNGRLFIPPAKIIIPKFSLSDWDIVLATIGEKVFPLGGVRKLFTMNGHLLGDSKDLQDNHFYVAAGLETFKYFPYWKSPRVPSEVQQRYANVEKKSQRKKKVDSKGKEPCHYDGIPPKTQDSVYYAKEERKKTLAEPLVQRGAEDDVYKAPTPSKETQGALDVKEDRNVQLEVPVDQRQAEIVKEDEEIHENTPDFEGNKDEEDARLCEDVERKQEKEPFDLLEEKNTPVLLETPVEIEAHREPLMRQSQEKSSPRQEEQTPEEQESSEQPCLGQPHREQTPEMPESSTQLFSGQSSQEQPPETPELPTQPSSGQ